jgi:hypothetical protein
MTGAAEISSIIKYNQFISVLQLIVKGSVFLHEDFYTVTEQKITHFAKQLSSTGCVIIMLPEKFSEDMWHAE